MNEKEEKNQVKSSDLAEAETFSGAIASRDEIIAERNETIKVLKAELGKREKIISENIKKIDIEKSLRVEAESKVTEAGKLDKNSSYHTPKSKEEQFAESYREACQKIRNK